MSAARGRAALAWMALFFIAGELSLGVLVNRAHPEVRDPIFATLLSGLRREQVAAAGQPLILVLGTSRAANAIRPAAAGDDRVLLYNFAIPAAGPVRQMQTFNRVRANGIRPDWLVVEVWPPYLTHQGDYTEDNLIYSGDLALCDWFLLDRYLDHPGPCRRKLLDGLLAPAWAHRGGLLAHCAPALNLNAPKDGWSDPRRRTSEPGGWLPVPGGRITADRWYLEFTVRPLLLRPILDEFRPSPAADRAVHDLLNRCADDGIRVALLLCPDHSAHRACYTPQAQSRIRTYLAELSAQYGVSVVDTRKWIVDDDFADPVHLGAEAAAPYTQRLMRDVIRPLLAGRTPANVLPSETPGGLEASESRQTP
jgi:hypothetical protein